jgi:hypothetical protein
MAFRLYPQWHSIPAKLHKRLPEVIKGMNMTDKQDGNLISLAFIFKESRLRYENSRDEGLKGSGHRLSIGDIPE